MTLENIRKQIAKDEKGKQIEIEKKELMEKEAKRFFMMGEGYLDEKNYSMSFFSYFKSFKIMCSMYVNKKIGGIELDENSAVLYIAKKNLFGVDEKKLEDLELLARIITNRKEVESKDAREMGKITARVKDELFPKRKKAVK